jgi:hypothetical protein
MRLKNGDRVKHPALPAWGIGQVLGDPVDNTVRVFFVGVGEKVIALDRVSLMLVTGTEAHEALLDNLRRSDSGAVIRYRSLPESIAYFLRQYPGGFYGQTFMKQERNYKVAAHELCSDLLSKTKLEQLLSSRDCDEVIREALRVVNATNLIFPNEKMSFRDGLADLATRTRFAEALYDLLHGVGVLEQRFLGFIRVLEAIGAAKWTIASYFPFLFDPNDYVFLKPTVTQHAAEVCGFEINYRSELNWRTYERVQAFARYLEGAIAELKPRDMIDIQSFMWCIAPE